MTRSENLSFNTLSVKSVLPSKDLGVLSGNNLVGLMVFMSEVTCNLRANWHCHMKWYYIDKYAVSLYFLDAIHHRRCDFDIFAS